MREQLPYQMFAAEQDDRLVKVSPGVGQHIHAADEHTVVIEQDDLLVLFIQEHDHGAERRQLISKLPAVAGLAGADPLVGEHHEPDLHVTLRGGAQASHRSWETEPSSG